MIDQKPQHFSLLGLLKSFSFAMEGIIFALKTQRNMLIHLLATIFVCGLGFWLRVSIDDWRWLLLCIAIVWFSELMNTAFEYLCDIVMPQAHQSVKRAKDIAAGSVLVCAIIAALIGILTFFPYLYQFANNM